MKASNPGVPFAFVALVGASVLTWPAASVVRCGAPEPGGALAEPPGLADDPSGALEAAVATVVGTEDEIGAVELPVPVDNVGTLLVGNVAPVVEVVGAEVVGEELEEVDVGGNVGVDTEGVVGRGTLVVGTCASTEVMGKDSKTRKAPNTAEPIR